MAEVVLAAVVVALLVWNVVEGRAARRERARLLHALMATHPGEYVALERDVEAPKRSERTDRPEPEALIPHGA